MKKKKSVGIITFHTAHNYGAMLQTYALQTILSKKYDAKVIDYKNDEFKKVYSIIKFNKKNIFTIMKSFVANIAYFPRRYRRKIAFENFKNQYMNLTNKYETQEQLKQNPPKCDVYITGSDQVWNYKISGGKVDAYTLNFGTNEVKRISYAASIGTDELETNHKEEYIEKIKRLEHISVREKEAKLHLEKYIDKPIKVVVDPTVLLEQKEWEELIENVKQEKEEYILGYIINETPVYYEILNYLSKLTGLKVIHFGAKNKNIKNVLKLDYSKGPKEFVSLIKNAKYIVTTSFHASIFSIIFNKKFWVIPPSKTSHRITDFLNSLDIEDRIIYSLEELKQRNYDEEINYEVVEGKLENLRNESLNFLSNAVK